MTNLNVGIAQLSDAADLGSGDSGSFHRKHRLQDSIELRYARGHVG